MPSFIASDNPQFVPIRFHRFGVKRRSARRSRPLSAKGTERRGSEGKRCYAIGDVHGRLDLLEPLLMAIGRDLEERNASVSVLESEVVFLGDLIDRGSDSRGVVEAAKSFSAPRTRVHLVLGNHEEMLLRGLGGEPHVLRDWIEHGGRACAASYGIAPQRVTGLDGEALKALLIAAIPVSHLAFLRSGVQSVRFGDFFMAHAGIRPGRPLGSQTGADLRWIRRDFLDSDRDHGVVVVHGHTPSENVERRFNRIGIDTGAFSTGVLTALRIEGPGLAVLQACERRGVFASRLADPSFESVR